MFKHMRLFKIAIHHKALQLRLGFLIWVRMSVGLQSKIRENLERKRVRLKKNTLSQSLREFFNPTRHAVFYFLFFIFFYFNWPLPPRTSETKNDWKVSTSVFSEIKQDFTRFLSSHVLKFFQNSKLSSFFVVKMKKKIISRKKKESLNFAKSNAHRKTNAGGSFETQNFFFRSLMIGIFFCLNEMIILITCAKKIFLTC